MTDTKELEQVIATYLEGLHNPKDDSLHNELRAKRDTEALKKAIYAYIDRQLEIAVREARIDELQWVKQASSSIATGMYNPYMEQEIDYRLAQLNPNHEEQTE